MTRNEFYIEQAKKYAQKDNIKDKEALAFIAGMKMADTHPEWFDTKERLPVPTDGDDFLVKLEGCEEEYAYAWYAYDRQCFMCYATGLSLGLGVTHYKPIISPNK